MGRRIGDDGVDWTTTTGEDVAAGARVLEVRTEDGASVRRNASGAVVGRLRIAGLGDCVSDCSVLTGARVGDGRSVVVTSAGKLVVVPVGLVMATTDGRSVRLRASIGAGAGGATSSCGTEFTGTMLTVSFIAGVVGVVSSVLVLFELLLLLLLLLDPSPLTAKIMPITAATATIVTANTTAPAQIKCRRLAAAAIEWVLASWNCSLLLVESGES